MLDKRARRDGGNDPRQNSFPIMATHLWKNYEKTSGEPKSLGFSSEDIADIEKPEDLEPFNI
jgi:hypothetical protein